MENVILFRDFLGVRALHSTWFPSIILLTPFTVLEYWFGDNFLKSSISCSQKRKHASYKRTCSNMLNMCHVQKQVDWTEQVIMIRKVKYKRRVLFFCVLKEIYVPFRISKRYTLFYHWKGRTFTFVKSFSYCLVRVANYKSKFF